MDSMEKQAHLNKQLTVIITLFDRVKFTYRWMEYANRFHFPFKILLADGGKDENIENVLGEEVIPKSVKAVNISGKTVTTPNSISNPLASSLELNLT